jgi:hypothetical protein
MNELCIVCLPAGPFFTRLFEEVLAPILVHSGYLPSLMQRISSSAVSASHLIREIDEAHMLLADLSEDTPEISFALGYAIAFGKPLCLISSRPQFSSPLSFEYPPTIAYPANAFPSDYLDLQQSIAKQLTFCGRTIEQSENATREEILIPAPVSLYASAETSKRLAHPTSGNASESPYLEDDDLVSYEVLALTLIDLRATEYGISPRDLGLEMRHNDSAHLTSHAMDALKRRGFIDRRPVELTTGSENFLSDHLFLTPAGEQWLIRNGKRSVRSSTSDSGTVMFQSF